MWKTPEQKRSPFLDDFVKSPGRASSSVHSDSSGPPWASESLQVETPFTQQFFNDSHTPHHEDENTSLEVLGI